MAWFDKIKRLFIREATPLPSDGEFFDSSKEFDADKIIKELGLSDKVVEEKTEEKSGDKTKFGSGKGNSGVLISELFLDDEDPVDLEGLKAKTGGNPSGEVNKEASPEDKVQSDQTDTSRDKSKVDDLKEALTDKSAELKGKMDNFLEDVEQKSRDLDEVERLEKEKSSGTLGYREKSLLDDKDDFFAKAKAFGEGHPMPPTGMEITQSESDKEKTDSDDKRKVYGFDDMDDDGDEITDDAVIEEE